MLLAEQNFDVATNLANQIRIVRRGTVVWASQTSTRSPLTLLLRPIFFCGGSSDPNRCEVKVEIG